MYQYACVYFSRIYLAISICLGNRDHLLDSHVSTNTFIYKICVFVSAFSLTFDAPT